MPKIIQLPNLPENTGRSVGAPAFFGSLSSAIKEEIRHNAIRRTFTDGQIIWHRGDIADGFWIIERGQAKLGHYTASGEMQALLIIGPGDSFGELACLGYFPRVVDAEAIGQLEMLWVSDTTLSALIAKSPEIARAMLGTLSQQFQEALDHLIVLRNLPAPKRLAQRLLALSEGKEEPARLAIRQQELAELVGVSRMTIASTLAQMEELGLISRHYRHLVVNDRAALRAWMKS